MSGETGPSERRREPRYPANDPVEVCILESRSERVRGTILDISRSGLRLELQAPVAMSVHLEIILPNRAVIFGETRYCRRHSDTFQLGVSIDDVYFAQVPSFRHVEADVLSRYLVGMDLTILEVMQIRDHLTKCSACRERATR